MREKLDAWAPWGFVALRVFAGVAMALHGWAKLGRVDGFVEGVASMGFPLPVVFSWLAILSELVGGLLVAVGFAVRPASVLVMGTMLVAAFVRHWDDPWSKKEFALLYFFVFGAFFLAGAGKASVDGWLSRRRDG